MDKAQVLVEKIQRVVDLLETLQKDKERLRLECEALKTHVALLTHENARAQQIFAEHEELRRTQEQVTHRVERALQKLNTLGQVS